MRILLMIRRLWQGGGTETHVLTLAAGLKKHGHRVAIYTSGGPWVRYARQQGIPVYVDGGTWGKASLGTQRFARFLRQHPFDVIHAHDTVSLNRVMGARQFQSRQPSLVFSVHGPYVSSSAIRLAGRYSRAVVPVSEQLKHRVLVRCGVPAHKVFLVPNGIATDTFRPNRQLSLRSKYRIPASAFVVGYAGRFTFDKTLLSRRISRIVRDYTRQSPLKVYGFIAGRGAKQNISPSRRLHVLGHVSNMARFYNTCDVVIGTGRVALEALLCGVPVIAIGTGGYAGLVTPSNVSGMIRSNFGDHLTRVRAFSDAELTRDLSAVYRHSEWVHRQSLQVRELVKDRLSANRMVQRMCRVYQSI